MNKKQNQLKNNAKKIKAYKETLIAVIDNLNAGAVGAIIVDAFTNALNPIVTGELGASMVALFFLSAYLRK